VKLVKIEKKDKEAEVEMERGRRRKYWCNIQVRGSIST
jgi:hypothetical protein